MGAIRPCQGAARRTRGGVPAETGLDGGRGDAGAAQGGGPPSSALRTGFGRLRTNGFGKRACGGEWGMRWGTETPCASPLPWVPARAGTTMGGVVRCVGARGWCQGGSPLSRAGGSRTAPTTGVGRTRVRVCAGAASGGGALRQAQGERIWEARVRWGVGDAMGGRRRPAPRAPLDTGFRRYDARGGVREGREVGTSPRRAPALGSRESGNDDGGCGGMRWREGFGSGWGPALAGGRFANRPYDRGGAHEGGGVRGGCWWWRGPSTGSGRTDLGGARAVGSGGCDGGLLPGDRGSGRQQTRLLAYAKTPAPGVSTCEPKGRGGSNSILGKLLGSVKPSTSGGGIRRLGRRWSPGPGRRPIRSPRWRRRGRGRCRR